MILKRSILAFLMGLAVLSYLKVCENCTEKFDTVCVENPIIFSILYYFVVNSLIVMYYMGQEDLSTVHFKILWASMLCGFLIGFGIIIMYIAPSTWTALGLHFFMNGQFHMLEFIVGTIFIHNYEADYESFLVRTIPFQFVGILEYLCEAWMYPGMKEMGCVSYIGIFIYIFADMVVRKPSVINMSSNFNHIVQMEHKEGHVLVTSGIHSLCRHPSYFGLYWGSVANQIYMMNPVAFAMIGWSSWYALQSRIVLEDITLLRFFGPEYVEFQKKTPTGLPFVDGYDYFVKNPDAKLIKVDGLWCAENEEINLDMTERTKETHDPLGSVFKVMKKNLCIKCD